MMRAHCSRTTPEHCRGGIMWQGCAHRRWGAAGPQWARNSPAAHLPRQFVGLVRLVRRGDRRSPRIMMVVMLAQHHQRQTCATGRAISSRSGQCSGSKQSWGALEVGCSVGGGSGSPGCAGRGARLKRGAREPRGLSELSPAIVAGAHFGADIGPPARTARMRGVVHSEGWRPR